MSTIDVVAMPTEDGIEPVIMEHHGVGYFGILDDVEKGLIPKKMGRNVWQRMLRIHRQNIERTYREGLQKYREELQRFKDEELSESS